MFSTVYDGAHYYDFTTTDSLKSELDSLKHKRVSLKHKLDSLRRKPDSLKRKTSFFAGNANLILWNVNLILWNGNKIPIGVGHGACDTCQRLYQWDGQGRIQNKECFRASTVSLFFH